MSGFEIISVVFMVASLMLNAIELGCKLSSKKRPKVKPPSSYRCRRLCTP